MAFDPLTLLSIDLIACTKAIELDDTVPPITLFTDELISESIKEYFKDEPDWTDELLPIALKEYRDGKVMDEYAKELASSIMPRYF
jgi:hypothetical protein